MKRITLAAGIWLVVAICLGVGAGAVGVLLYELNATSNGYEESQKGLQESARRMDAARVVQVTFKKQVQEWKDLLLRGSDPEERKLYTAQFRAEAAKVADLSRTLQASLGDSSERSTVDEFLRSFDVMRSRYEAALDVFEKAGGANAHEVDQLVKGQDRTATDLLDGTVDRLVSRANQAIASRRELISGRIQMVTLAVLLLFACIGIGVSYFVRGLSGTLRRAVRDLAQGAEQVAGAAGQISSSSHSLAQGASGQAASLQETSAAGEEINAMARRNAENSQSANALMALSQQKVVETNQSLEAAVIAMGQMKESGDKVARIIRVIDEIAFQTNILALNAAVEAARAGEAGMGFGVVADEVRNLAQRCTLAARDTADLIEESIARSGDGKSRVDQVAVAIRSITEESAKVTVLVEAVSAGSREQMVGIGQVTQSLARIEHVTQQSAASAEEGAAAAQELTAQASALRDVVGRLSAMVGRF